MLLACLTWCYGFGWERTVLPLASWAHYVSPHYDFWGTPGLNPASHIIMISTKQSQNHSS